MIVYEITIIIEALQLVMGHILIFQLSLMLFCIIVITFCTLNLTGTNWKTNFCNATSGDKGN